MMTRGRVSIVGGQGYSPGLRREQGAARRRYRRARRQHRRGDRAVGFREVDPAAHAEPAARARPRATSCSTAGRSCTTIPTSCGSGSAWCSSISICSRTAACWTTSMLAPRKLKRLSGDAARELALAQLDRVGMKHKADSRPGDAVRRATATSRDRPGAGDGAAGDVLRRSDLGAGPRTGQGNPGADRRSGLRRHDDAGRHPRDGLSPGRHPTPSCSWTTARWWKPGRPSRYSRPRRPSACSGSCPRYFDSKTSILGR